MLTNLTSTYSATRGYQRLEIKNPKGDEVVLYQESHALVIGVSNYTNGWPKLFGVKTDIKQVSLALQKNGFSVKTILDPNSQQLARAFKDFINQYGNKVENRLLFYFAGHGHTIKPRWGGKARGYIVPTDAPNPNKDLKGFKATALPMQRIEEYALDIDAKHGLFLFDSCFSGTLFAISRAIPENISYKTAKPVRQFITAGTDNEQVPDISIFRQQFIAALNGEGDQDNDGYLTGTELGEFLQTKVINYSRGAQHPQYGKIRNPFLDKGDFVFKVKNRDKVRGGMVDSQENHFWDAIDQNNADELGIYLRKYPQGYYAAIAQNRLKNVTRQYIVNNNGTVKDTKTGLMWKRCTEGLSGSDCSMGKAKTYNWNKAVNKFKNISYAGYSDWRLPTVKELNTLVYCSNGIKPEYKKDGYWSKKDCSSGNTKYQKPTINQQVFPNTSYIYWSSSPSVDFSYLAWSIYFSYGYDGGDRRSSELFARLVRVGQ